MDRSKSSCSSSCCVVEVIKRVNPFINTHSHIIYTDPISIYLYLYTYLEFNILLLYICSKSTVCGTRELFLFCFCCCCCFLFRIHTVIVLGIKKNKTNFYILEKYRFFNGIFIVVVVVFCELR